MFKSWVDMISRVGSHTRLFMGDLFGIYMKIGGLYPLLIRKSNHNFGWSCHISPLLLAVMHPVHK